MNAVCFYCGSLGRHELCTGMVRPISLPAEPCTCTYPLHPAPSPVVAHPPARNAAATPGTAAGSGGGGLNP